MLETKYIRLADGSVANKEDFCSAPPNKTKAWQVKCIGWKGRETASITKTTSQKKGEFQNC